MYRYKSKSYEDSASFRDEHEENFLKKSNNIEIYELAGYFLNDNALGMAQTIFCLRGEYFVQIASDVDTIEEFVRVDDSRLEDVITYEGVEKFAGFVGGLAIHIFHFSDEYVWHGPRHMARSELHKLENINPILMLEFMMFAGMSREKVMQSARAASLVLDPENPAEIENDFKNEIEHLECEFWYRPDIWNIRNISTARVEMDLYRLLVNDSEEDIRDIVVSVLLQINKTWIVFINGSAAKFDECLRSLFSCLGIIDRKSNYLKKNQILEKSRFATSYLYGLMVAIRYWRFNQKFIIAEARYNLSDMISDIVLHKKLEQFSVSRPDRRLGKLLDVLITIKFGVTCQPTAGFTGACTVSKINNDKSIEVNCLNSAIIIPKDLISSSDFISHPPINSIIIIAKLGTENHGTRTGRKFVKDGMEIFYPTQSDVDRPFQFVVGASNSFAAVFASPKKKSSMLRGATTNKHVLQLADLLGLRRISIVQIPRNINEMKGKVSIVRHFVNDLLTRSEIVDETLPSNPSIWPDIIKIRLPEDNENTHSGHLSRKYLKMARTFEAMFIKFFSEFNLKSEVELYIPQKRGAKSYLSWNDYKYQNKIRLGSEEILSEDEKMDRTVIYMFSKNNYK